MIIHGNRVVQSTMETAGLQDVLAVTSRGKWKKLTEKRQQNDGFIATNRYTNRQPERTGIRGDRLRLDFVRRHNSEKFLFVDLAVLVKVEFVYHSLSRGQKDSEQLQESRTETHNSSSSKRSPISLATRLKFLRLLFPVLSSSKS